MQMKMLEMVVIFFSGFNELMLSESYYFLYKKD